MRTADTQLYRATRAARSARCARGSGLTLHLVELVRMARAHANVPHLAGLHDVVERLHRLLDGRVVVKPKRK